MLPTGHLAGGALLGAWRSRRSDRNPVWPIAAGMGVAVVPDADLMIPKLLDGIGIRHRLNSGVHHRWATHTPLFWALALSGLHRVAAASEHAPDWAPEAVDLLALGVAVHIAQDSVANTVSLLWPLRRDQYGLGLDRMPEVTDHLEYLQRYPSSPAGKLEAALVLAALAVCTARLARWQTEQ